METEEQKKDRERLNRYIARENLVSIMNNTKWSELRDLMLSMKKSPRYRVMCLRIENDSGYYWDTDWYYHLPTYKWIEWLDIDPIHREFSGHQLIENKQTDLTQEIEKKLFSINIPFSIEEGYIRVWGYQRPGKSIEFAYQGSGGNG